MNAKELAEKIIAIAQDASRQAHGCVLWHVEEALSAALEEAIDKAREVGHAGCRKEAYEDAAKIVDGQARLLRDSAKATSLVLDRDEQEAFAECVEKLASTIRAKVKEQSDNV